MSMMENGALQAADSMFAQSEADGVFGDIGDASDVVWGHIEKLFAQLEDE